MFEAQGWIKFYEQDNWKSGCDPKTGSSFSDKNDVFTGRTIQEVVEKCKDFVGVDSNEDCSFDACEELGRLDISKMETDDSQTPSKVETKAWKAGKARLWACTYTFRINRVERHPVNLTAALEYGGI